MSKTLRALRVRGGCAAAARSAALSPLVADRVRGVEHCACPPPVRRAVPVPVTGGGDVAASDRVIAAAAGARWVVSWQARSADHAMAPRWVLARRSGSSLTANVERVAHRRGSTLPSMLAGIANRDLYPVSLARRVHSPLEALVRLCAHPSYIVREALAENSSTPPVALLWLASDPISLVSRAALSNRAHPSRSNTGTVDRRDPRRDLRSAHPSARTRCSTVPGRVTES